MHWHTLYVEWNAHMYGSMPELNGDVVESSETLPMERERERLLLISFKTYGAMNEVKNT